MSSSNSQQNSSSQPPTPATSPAQPAIDPKPPIRWRRENYLDVETAKKIINPKNNRTR
ncbi:hypothetical protein SAMN05444673_4053 [Bacillus sp. OV166]|uniref:hypothetical protein n=1 Tax=Bacillus sp. OV166 TaxID=1882763 RepID=UPI000A2AAB7B|nr:hypothetical protein [Bacillus sp. OV166]SMQ80948.1 hypothetical protein SAMN05444673_4053 [Bacillus sp. OV166]